MLAATSALAMSEQGRPGRLNWTYLRVETARALRDPWMLSFSLVMPVVLYLLFGVGPAYAHLDVGRGDGAGLVAANMALFGSMSAAVNVAGAVAAERGIGWHRQLRLTPLRGFSYVTAKFISASVVSLGVVTGVLVTAFATGARLDLAVTPTVFVIAWVGGSSLFAAFGLAAGFCFTGESVLSIIGMLTSVLAFLGGLLVPLSLLSDFVQELSPFTPMYGLHDMIECSVRGVPWESVSVLNVLVWFSFFTGIAIWRYRSIAARP
ncbi:ABC transporter permease [Austwickia chelonae]|uniref:ABC transporter permease n=1 Tax=Austwickia chelonae TaxID=100225 RepID=UPI000E26E3C5|nr:ABC transporter permease [Austwickia chelonae]